MAGLEMAEMMAYFFDGKVARLRDDYPSPVPGAEDALISVAMAGICNTDLEILKGYMDFKGVLGHEFVGSVVKCEARPDLVGRRVVGDINFSCGSCTECRNGREHHCPSRSVLGIVGHDGSFAEYVKVPVANLATIPEEVKDRHAVFAEPLAAALRIPQQVKISPSDRIVIIGDGKLGLLVAQVVARMGALVTVIGHHEDKMAILTRWGVTTATDVPANMPLSDVVVECTGKARGAEMAASVVRPMGTLVLKSTYVDGSVRASTLAKLVVDEITVVGSRCGPLKTAVEWIRRGLVDVDPLVSAIYPFVRADEAMVHAQRRGAMKVILEMR
jgi:threonine dehydrogenase-like Zn-dependent dehydrogenase